MARVEVRENQRDGLRMLALEKLGELLRIRLLKALELNHAHLGGSCNLLQQLLRPGVPKRLHEQFFGVVRAALGDITLRERELLILLEHRDRGLRTLSA